MYCIQNAQEHIERVITPSQKNSTWQYHFKLVPQPLWWYFYLQQRTNVYISTRLVVDLLMSLPHPFYTLDDSVECQSETAERLTKIIVMRRKPWSMKLMLGWPWKIHNYLSFILLNTRPTRLVVLKYFYPITAPKFSIDKSYNLPAVIFRGVKVRIIMNLRSTLLLIDKEYHSLE